MIDLHLHSSVSDGLLAPAHLVARIVGAGVSAFSLTDHDTVGGLDAAADAAAARGIRFVTGIEITAVEGGRDLHILGYGIDPRSAPLRAFLAAQRSLRRARVVLVLERLAALGLAVDATRVLEAARRADRPVGRPHVARAMVAAGHVASVSEAFDRWLAAGRPAFVPRDGPAPAAVIAAIHDAGGLASLAHPGVSGRDELIPALADAGLDALEVWHTDHDVAATGRYRALALDRALLMTGGSDFHGDGADRPCGLGRVGVSEDVFAALIDRLRASRRRGGPPERGW